jgi:hypothetical protein
VSNPGQKLLIDADKRIWEVSDPKAQCPAWLILARKDFDQAIEAEQEIFKRRALREGATVEFSGSIHTKVTLGK